MNNFCPYLKITLKELYIFGGLSLENGNLKDERNNRREF